MSIADIHRTWNEEIHSKAGRTQYSLQDCENTLQLENKRAKNVPDHLRPLEAALQQFQASLMVGNWHDASGQRVHDERIAGTLIELVKGGDLKVYKSMNPNDAAFTVVELRTANLERKSKKCFIDRDELGCLLIANSLPLPDFWYTLADHRIYQDRLIRQEEAASNQRAHIEALIKENDSLKRLVNERLPYMDATHPFFEPELEATVSGWMEHFDGKTRDDANIAQKLNLERWVKANRPDAIRDRQGRREVSESALDRIVQMLNPNKKGGRPKG